MDVDSPVVDLQELKTWQDTLSNATLSDLDTRPGLSPFHFDEKINRKISYWIGNIWVLKADAIVCCNNETFTLKTDLITRNTLICAGRDLVHELRNVIKFCRTGEAVVTNGHALPCSRIIHVVGPRYSDKYATAAESALHNAYRNVLMQAKENKLRTVALRCIHSSVWQYPSMSGAHVALRTVRRFLEKYEKDFDSIIFAVSNHNKEAYNILLPLYFPRSKTEETLAVNRLPPNIGDEYGQLFIPERQIRISAIPYYKITHDDGDDDEEFDGGCHENDDEGDEDGGNVSSKREDEESIENETKLHLKISDPSFLEMKESVDKERIKKIVRGKLPNDALIRRQFYKRLLIRAQKVDLTDLVRKRFLYHCGYDRQNRPVMIFLAHRWFLKMQEPNWTMSKSLPNLNRRNEGSNIFTRYFKADDSSNVVADEANEKYRLFFINQMEPLVKQKYVFLYIQSLCDKDDSLPSTKCMQALLGMIDTRYIANLDALYILHSTLANKIRYWFRLPSVLFDKTVFLKGVEHLYSLISPDELELPEFVLAHDLDLYGVRYYEGQSDEETIR